jgi:hypothetical protein
MEITKEIDLAIEVTQRFMEQKALTQTAYNALNALMHERNSETFTDEQYAQISAVRALLAKKEFKVEAYLKTLSFTHERTPETPG